MIDDHHGWAAGRATLLVRAVDGILGTHRACHSLLSSAGTTYNRDYFAETPEGDQRPVLNMFHRDGETIRHFWGSELFYAPAEPGQDPRPVGTIEPLWNLYDLTPAGRGTDWEEQLSYS